MVLWRDVVRSCFWCPLLFVFGGWGSNFRRVTTPLFLQTFKHNETCENGWLRLGSRPTNMIGLMFTNTKTKPC